MILQRIDTSPNYSNLPQSASATTGDFQFLNNSQSTLKAQKKHFRYLAPPPLANPKWPLKSLMRLQSQAIDWHWQSYKLGIGQMMMSYQNAQLKCMLDAPNKAT